MSLRGPNDGDVPKINAEINQIINQRFIITTLAITLFGGVIAWLIPKNIPPSGSNLDAFTFEGSILLLLLLFILFLYTHILKGMLRIFTTYLLVTNSSNWEYDWRRYKKEHYLHYLGYTAANTIVFLVLGILSTVYPFILAKVYSLKFASQSWFMLNIVVGIVYLILVVAMGFFRVLAPETKAKEKWEKL